MHQVKYYHNHRKLVQLSKLVNTSSHKGLMKTHNKKAMSKEKTQSDHLKVDFVECLSE